jgi:predicted RNA-binding protein
MTVYFMVQENDVKVFKVVADEKVFHGTTVSELAI